MKKLAFLAGAGGMGMLALLGSHLSQAADHGDAPTAKASPMADIADVYAWNTADASKVNLAMTFSPEDDGTRTFGSSVQYAFHVTSRAGFPATTAGMESKIICTFTSDTAGKCWLVAPNGKTLDYVEGDLSNTAGKASASGKFRVFAGRRSDPFFMNLGGIVQAIGYAIQHICASTSCPGNATVDAAKCPTAVLATDAAIIQTLIKTKPSAPVAGTPCTAADIDCFVGFNVMAIVVQVDKTELLQGTDKVLGVWASTHTGA